MMDSSRPSRGDRRWDDDDRGRGIADGTAFAAGVDQLRKMMTIAGWVAEEPETHLLPHIRRSCEAAGFRLLGDAQDGTVYTVRLEWLGEAAQRAVLRQAIFAVIGSFAESSTLVRQRTYQERVEFEVVTGMAHDETVFRSHGHLICLQVSFREPGQ